MEVLSDSGTTLRLLAKHTKLPSRCVPYRGDLNTELLIPSTQTLSLPHYRLTWHTARSVEAGQGLAALQIGPHTKPALKAGRWMITVSGAHVFSAVSYKIGAFLFEDIDKDPVNVDLYGRITAEDDDDWEVG